MRLSHDERSFVVGLTLVMSTAYGKSVIRRWISQFRELERCMSLKRKEHWRKGEEHSGLTEELNIPVLEGFFCMVVAKSAMVVVVVVALLL